METGFVAAETLREKLAKLVHAVRLRTLAGEIHARAIPTGAGDEFDIRTAQGDALMYLWIIDWEADTGRIEFCINDSTANEDIVDMTHWTAEEIVRRVLDEPWADMPRMA